jgi:bacterioferritin
MMSLPDLKMAIAHCEDVKDFVSRELFTDILESEEEHIDWLQTQLRLVEQMGLQNFVQLQTKPNASGS